MASKLEAPPKPKGIFMDTTIEAFLMDFIKYDGKILVANCGKGELPISIKDKYPEAEVWGSELDMALLDECRRINKKVMFANHPLENDDFENEFFDTIFIQDYIPSKISKEKYKYWCRLWNKLKKQGNAVIVTKYPLGILDSLDADFSGCYFKIHKVNETSIIQVMKD
jgi:hypothetical protein